MAAASAARPVPETLRVYARGVVGGLIFSLPLLYTMEVWEAGHTASPERLLALLLGTIGLLLAYNWAGGLRAAQGWGENLFEAAEELCLGFGTAAVVLFLLGQIDGASPGEWVGKVTLEGAIAAIGVSVGTEQLGDAEGAAVRGGREGRFPKIVAELATAALGATLIAANVAPTDEVGIIAAEAGPAALLGLVIASVTLAGILLNATDMRGADRLSRREAGLGPFRGTAVTYAVAVAVSALLLWVLGRFDGEGIRGMVNLSVVLALPATLGAAAGRLLLGGDVEDEQ
jgi:putative integral membrane protein (TIGR02587 family)